MRPGRLLLAAAGLTVLAAAPAAAHPFGPPPTARITAEGSRMVVDWSATPDDAVAIGERLGLMPPGSVAAYREESVAQVAPSAADEARLSAAPDLHRYLTRHIGVTQDGTACRSEVVAVPDFVHSGATVEITCRRDITTVLLRISMLHDIHPAYRTVAVGTGSTPSRAVFTATAPEHQLVFGAAQGQQRLSGVAVAAGLGAVVLGGMLVVRRRARR